MKLIIKIFKFCKKIKREEIGFNIEDYISEKDYIEYKKQDKKKISKMYIISDIDEETFFRTNTRCEIGKIG